jgi:IS1 family transposase
MRDLQMNEVQLDVLWTFVKKKRPLTRSNSSKGEVWIWTAVDTTTRVIVNYRVGTHFLEDARIMLKELTSSLSGRSPLFVSDELAHYESVLEELFSHDEPVPRTGKRGRPPNPVRVVEPDPLYATMKKTRKKGRMVKVDQYVKTPKTGKLSKKFTLFSVSYKRQLPKKGLFAG